MNYYQKYIKYKTKYLNLKENKYFIQNGGTILYNSNKVGLSKKIISTKKEIFFDIILWILQDSIHNIHTKKYNNGFVFITNSAKLIFNDNDDGFEFINNNNASKDEIFELIFVINKIINIKVPKDFKITDLNYKETDNKTDNKNKIYKKINFINNFFNNKDNTNLENIFEPKNIIKYSDNMKITTDNDKFIPENMKKPNKPFKPIEENKYQKHTLIDDFEPNTFFPSGVFTYPEPLPYKREIDDDFDSSISSNISSSISSNY